MTRRASSTVMTRDEMKIRDFAQNYSSRRMPAQKPGKSFQSYSTPRDFLEAVKKKFAVKAWAWDLAANKSNSVTATATNKLLYFGPDHMRVDWRDALDDECGWTRLRGDLWLNPPYADIAPWAAKCAESAFYDKCGNFLKCARRIFFLVPAAVGSNWWADYVHEKALVVFPRPRLSFDGKNSYPKDVSLILYGEKPSYMIWRWKESTR